MASQILISHPTFLWQPGSGDLLLGTSRKDYKYLHKKESKDLDVYEQEIFHLGKNLNTSLCALWMGLS